jgi:hypothetical protein
MRANNNDNISNNISCHIMNNDMYMHIYIIFVYIHIYARVFVNTYAYVYLRIIYKVYSSNNFTHITTYRYITSNIVTLYINYIIVISTQLPRRRYLFSLFFYSALLKSSRIGRQP